MQTVSVQKASLRVVGLAGALAFVTFFSFTYSIPGWVEQFATAFIEAEVAEQIDSRIDGLRLRRATVPCRELQRRSIGKISKKSRD